MAIIQQEKEHKFLDRRRIMKEVIQWYWDNNVQFEVSFDETGQKAQPVLIVGQTGDTSCCTQGNGHIQKILL